MHVDGDVSKKNALVNVLTMQYVVDTHITEEQISLWTKTFSMFDRDGSGSIDAEEFRGVFEVMGMRIRDEELGLMMQDLDKNNDGAIDLEEFISAMRSKYKDLDLEENVKTAFDVFDTDDSGSLSFEEMSDVLMNLGQDMTHQKIRNIMELADVDGDGEIDIDEFMAVCAGRNF